MRNLPNFLDILFGDRAVLHRFFMRVTEMIVMIFDSDGDGGVDEGAGDSKSDDDEDGGDVYEKG